LAANPGPDTGRGAQPEPAAPKATKGHDDPDENAGRPNAERRVAGREKCHGTDGRGPAAPQVKRRLRRKPDQKHPDLERRERNWKVNIGDSESTTDGKASYAPGRKPAPGYEPINFRERPMNVTDPERESTKHEPEALGLWRHAPEPDGKEAFKMPPPGGWLRFESGLLKPEQTLKNLETIVSLLQKAAEGLGRIDGLIEDMQGTVNMALLNGRVDEQPPDSLTEYVRTRLNQVNEIVRQCRFHGRGLLDGMSGVNGVGTGVVFVRGGPGTKSSPPEGFPVEVHQVPRQALMVGGVSLNQDWLAAEDEIFLAEGEHFLRFRVDAGETVDQFLARLQEELLTANLELQVGLTGQGRLLVRHWQYGSQQKFKGYSNKTPILSRTPGKVEWCVRGRDIKGTINSEPTFGVGRMMVGYLDNPTTSELGVVWHGGARDENGLAGRIYLAQNALTFQDDETQTRPPARLALPSFHSRLAGRWMDQPSGYGCLDDMRFSTWQEVRDSLHMLFAVSCEVDDWKGNLESWIKRYQGQALACLRRGRIDPDDDSGDNPGDAREAEQMAMLLKELIQGTQG